MKNIYNITIGQLITTWTFGFIAIYLTMKESCHYLKACLPGLPPLPGTGGYSFSEADKFILIILFILTFYTIGWINNRKIKQ